ncbi:HlyD family efflux transporter periplasmic adaptor subunit [Streptomyces lunalinharesii]|uniref:HlyD family efflux transporter periplasmic adaptor subunit n=1 Tax=Streptomyces lunalinharesii TaxID=333384 RepID=A0ABP6EYY2_9ACTN
MEYRRNALARLEQPEELDVPVRFAHSGGWLALGMLVVALLAGVGWAFVGTIPRSATGAGILTHPHGGFPVTSTAAGQLVSIGDNLAVGKTINAGDVVAQVVTPDQQRVDVQAAASGVVTSVAAHNGQVVTANTPLAIAEPASDADAQLVAVLYLPPGSIAGIAVGQQVDLTVASAPPPKYGSMRGTVAAVGNVPESRAQIASFLADEDLAARFAQSTQPVRVVVQLTPAKGRTPTGLVWSNGAEPPFPLPSRSLVSGSVHLAGLRPVDWFGSK